MDDLLQLAEQYRPAPAGGDDLLALAQQMRPITGRNAHTEDQDAGPTPNAAPETLRQAKGSPAVPLDQMPGYSPLGPIGQAGIPGMAADFAARPTPQVVPLGGPPDPSQMAYNRQQEAEYAARSESAQNQPWASRMAQAALGNVLGAAGGVEAAWRNIPAQIGSTLRGETSAWDTFTTGGANLPQPVSQQDAVVPGVIASAMGAPALGTQPAMEAMQTAAGSLDPVSGFIAALPAFPIQFADPKALAVMIATRRPVGAALDSMPVQAMLGAVGQRFGPRMAEATGAVLANVTENAAFGAGMGVAEGKDRAGVAKEAALGAVTGLPFAVPGVGRAVRGHLGDVATARAGQFRETLRGINGPEGAIRTPEPARAVTPEEAAALKPQEFTNAPEKGRQEEGRPQGLLNEADEVAARVAKNHPGAVLELNDMSKTYDRPTWEVAAVEVKEKGKGQGSALMRDLIAEADKRGVRLVLEPTDELGGDVSRLPAFYERLGFTKSTDPKVSFSYVRDPAPAEVTPPGAIEAGATSPSERGAGDAPSAQGAGTPAEPPATASPQTGRTGSQPLESMSYADLMAEAKRLGVAEGQKARAALTARIRSAAEAADAGGGLAGTTVPPGPGESAARPGPTTPAGDARPPSLSQIPEPPAAKSNRPETGVHEPPRTPSESASLPPEPRPPAAGDEVRNRPGNDVRSIDEPANVMRSVGPEQAPAAEAAKHAPIVPDAPAGPKLSGDDDGHLTALKNVMTERDRKAFGLDALDGPERRSFARNLADAKAQGIPEKSLDLAASIVAKPRPITATENAGLTIKLVESKNAHKAAMDRFNAATDEADKMTALAEMTRRQQEVDVLTEAAKLGGTESGRALQARQMALAEDFSPAVVKAKARVAKGKELTPEQAAKFDGLTTRIEAVEKSVADLSKTMADQKAEAAINRHASGRRRTPKERDAEFSSLLDEAKKLLEQGCA